MPSSCPACSAHELFDGHECLLVNKAAITLRAKGQAVALKIWSLNQRRLPKYSLMLIFSRTAKAGSHFSEQRTKLFNVVVLVE